jgi:hypothetical protein
MRLPEHETRFPTEIRRMVSPSDRFKLVSHWREHIDTIEDQAEHESLKQALASHIWEARGGGSLSFQESDGDEFMEKKGTIKLGWTIICYVLFVTVLPYFISLY